MLGFLLAYVAELQDEFGAQGPFYILGAVSLAGAGKLYSWRYFRSAAVYGEWRRKQEHVSPASLLGWVGRFE
jgi:hypothetical protein